MRFVNRLREVRRARGLSVAELARRAGVSRETITKLERNDGHPPRAQSQLRLALALGATDLFWIEAEPGDPGGPPGPPPTA